jgi:hypothetical protein
MTLLTRSDPARNIDRFFSSPSRRRVITSAYIIEASITSMICSTAIGRRAFTILCSPALRGVRLQPHQLHSGKVRAAQPSRFYTVAPNVRKGSL